MSHAFPPDSSYIPNVPYSKNKKTDVFEHPEVFDHVGLLVNEPLGTSELLFT